MSFFDKQRKLENNLIELYTSLFDSQDYSNFEARELSQDLLEESIHSSKETGTYFLPNNMGDIVL